VSPKDPPTGPASRGVVLIGLRRSGKTQIGTLLAQHLNRPFLDTDAWCETTEGLSPAALITSRGEAYFREVERRAVLATTARPGIVLATGGGTPVNGDCGEILRSFGMIFYLCVNPRVLLERALADAHPETRPLIAGSNAREEVAALHAARDPEYRKLADLVVDADGTIDEVLAACKRACDALASD